MNVKKTIRKVIPKEYRKKIKEKFNIQTVSDEVKENITHAESVTIYSDELNVVLENDRFSKNSKIKIKKRGKVDKEIIFENFTSSNFKIPIENFLREIQKIEEKIERFDFFADFGDGYWVRLKSVFAQETNQFTYQNVSDEKVELIKIYTTLDGHYALVFNKFNEGLVLYEVDEERELLKIKNFSNEKNEELITPHGKLTLERSSEKEYFLTINEILNSGNKQINELTFALLEAKKKIHLIGLTITLSSNLLQNLVKVQASSEKFSVTEALKNGNKIILKTKDMIRGWDSDTLSIVAKRYNEILPLYASIDSNTITLEDRGGDLIKDFASKLYICRNLKGGTSLLSKIAINNSSKERDVFIAQLEDGDIDFLEKDGNFDCIFDNENSKMLLLSNPSFEVKALYLRYRERPVFKKIGFNKKGTYQIEVEAFENIEFMKNFLGIHIVYKVNDKFCYTYKKISDLIVEEELETL